MPSSTSSNRSSHVYAGLAGETGPGRVIKSGLYRMTNDEGDWELLTNGFPDAPAIRAIAAHPVQPEVVYVGTQNGPYRSTDFGNHWEKVNVPDHGLPVWSLMFHPSNPKIMFAGYESCEIYRSDDDGETWSQLPVSVRFPEVTVGPGANPAKRVLMLSGSMADANLLYGAIEVGGIIRSRDGGEHWENLSHGQYLNDDAVDMHGVLVSNLQPGMVLSVARGGMFRSTDWGDHWLRVQIEPLNAKQQTYCRSIGEVPGEPKTIWVSAGANFQSDTGALFRTSDGGLTWKRVDMGVQPKSTIFGLAFDKRNPKRMYCSTLGGDVFGSQDSGNTWKRYPLPEGAAQVYGFACS
jgi:photosystem II stability/assembly factor-like uncharacterized protein